MIEGLSHITFIVRDLERMTRFLTTLLDAEEVYASGETFRSLSREKFFFVVGTWIAVMEGEPLAEKTYNHVAFTVSPADLDVYAERAGAMGIEVRRGRERSPGEGQSLYLYDYDNHLFELHTGTLAERLAAYRKGQNNKSSWTTTEG